MSSLTCPAVMDEFPRLMDFVAAESRAAGFDEAAVNRIQLAFEEAVVNVINYAYGDGAGDVTVECVPPEGEQPGVAIRIIDSGQPFDPLAKEDPDITAPADERPIGGLGIFMIKKTMDNVTYERSEGRNIFTMTRLLTGGKE